MDQHRAESSDIEAPEGSAREGRPWERYYPPGLRWDMPIPAHPVPEILDRAASREGEKTAIEYRGRTISYRDLAGFAGRIAAGLLREGIGPGRTIALFLPNTPWHSACFFGALKAGARLAHLSPLDAPRELLHKLADSGADILITTDLGGMGAGAVKLAAAAGIATVFVGQDAFWGGAGDGLPQGARDLASLLDADPPARFPAIDPGDVALLQYTGGTTGLPKGAILTHANMAAATAIYKAWHDADDHDIGSQRVIGVLPMFHVYALGVILLFGIEAGVEILLRPRFDVEQTIRDIEIARATSFPAVPTMLIALLSTPGIETHDLSSLQWAGSGGAPLPTEIAARIEGLLRQPLRTGWGMTETAAAGTRVPKGVPMRPGLIGVPLPGIDMRIVDLTDGRRALAPGEIGEIAVRGPNITSGYWNQAELNQTSFADGFFLTGDIGSMDETGLFTIVDRKKRMIISGGFNVYPAAIENAIYEHPDVEETIVIGIPDAYRGEAAKAFLKMKDGRPDLTLDALRAFLADKLGRHEMPAALEIRPSLPKSPVGKLLASQLVEEERARTAASGA